MTIGVITPHQDSKRKMFLDRLSFYIQRQTLRPDHWIIVDHKEDVLAKDLTKRIRIGCEEAIELGCDVVLIMEDDDWYSPNYIKSMIEFWEIQGKPEIFGVEQTQYYHIKQGLHVELTHPGRASLMGTLLSAEGIKKITFPEDSFVFLDIELWKQLKGKTFRTLPAIAVGIKHGIGSTGGKGHLETFKGYSPDPEFKKLRQLIGDDSDFYINIFHPEIKKRKTIAIVTGVWKRPEVFEMFAKGIGHLIKNSDFNYHVIVAGSEGERSRKMVESKGYIYLEVPNTPLAAKMNATTIKAGQLGCDYVLCLGSDDVISPELMNVYSKEIEKGTDFIGVTDFYFYDTTTNRAAYWGGYIDARRLMHTAGAGRLISSRLMVKWNWQPWENKHSHILDNSVQEKLKLTPHSSASISLKKNNVFALDIKSSENMTPFQLWENTHYIDFNEIKKAMPYVWDSRDI
jgi:hypothetical protein